MVYGNGNAVDGTGCSVLGNNNTVRGTGCTCTGRNNRVHGIGCSNKERDVQLPAKPDCSASAAISAVPATTSTVSFNAPTYGFQSDDGVQVNHFGTITSGIINAGSGQIIGGRPQGVCLRTFDTQLLVKQLSLEVSEM